MKKLVPLLILAYLDLPLEEDDLLLQYYPDIHRYCNNYINNNINSLVRYRKPIYFLYKREIIDYPIGKYFKPMKI
jgi:hypothetical protein